MDPEALESDLRSLTQRYQAIATVPERPRTVMDVIERSLGPQQKAEVYVTRFLRYLLDPTEPHGLDDTLLRAFIEGLPAACKFHEDTADLTGVEVKTEVKVDRAPALDGDGWADRTGYVDLVLSLAGEWLLLVEVKFSAGENNLDGSGRTQTEFYEDATRINDIRKDTYESGEYYVYLHPQGTDPAVAPGFSNLTWEPVSTDVIQSVLADHAPRLPQRTVNQLHEFQDDIEHLAGMSDQTENRQEKIELYLEHYDAIADVTDTFDESWSEFTDEWGDMLADHLNDPGAEDWVFRQGTDDWAFLYKYGWWRTADTLDPYGPEGADGDTVRVGFLHRLDHHRTLAVRDRTLKFYFRNTPPNRYLQTDDGATNFRDEFIDAFDARKDEIEQLLPDGSKVTGNMHNMIKATYDIPVDEYDSYFDAYTGALATAFEEHAFDNEPLVSTLDAIYHDTLEMFE